MKNRFPDAGRRGAGFWIAAAAALLAFATSIVYRVSYAGNMFYSFTVFLLLLLCLPVPSVMFLTKTDGFAPAVLTALTAAALLAFIYATYFDISVVLVGIDKTGFDPEFIVCAVLITLSFLLSEVSVYTKYRKDAPEQEAAS